MKIGTKVRLNVVGSICTGEITNLFSDSLANYAAVKWADGNTYNYFVNDLIAHENFNVKEQAQRFLGQHEMFPDSNTSMSYFPSAYGLVQELYTYIEKLENIDCEKETEIGYLQRAIDSLKTAQNKAYNERNRLVSVLSKQYPSFLAKTNIEGWNIEWHWCVYLDTPVGQLSWHIHESELGLFEHLERKEGVFWDGSTTDDKYERLLKL